MTDALKELAKLEQVSALTNSKSKSKSVSLLSSLDALLESLHEFKHGIEAGAVSAEVLSTIHKTVEEKRAQIDERQKEIHASLGRLGKAIDKVRISGYHRPTHPPTLYI